MSIRPWNTRNYCGKRHLKPEKAFFPVIPKVILLCLNFESNPFEILTNLNKRKIFTAIVLPITYVYSTQFNMIMQIQVFEYDHDVQPNFRGLKETSNDRASFR